MEDNPALAGASRAALVAGPCFVLSVSAAALYGKMPQPIVITPGEIFGLLFLMIPAVVVGFLLGLLPSLLGSAIMGWLSRHIPTLRFPPIWALVGGAVAAAPVYFGGEGDVFSFGLIFTGAVCAMICRHHWRWD